MAELLKVLDGNTIPLLIRVYKKVEGNVREALPLDEVKNLQLRLVRREDNFVVKLVPHLRNVNEIYVRLFDQAPPPVNPHAPLFRGDAEMRPPIPEDAPPTPFRNTYPPERPAGGFNGYMKGTWGIELSGIYGTYKMRSLELRRIRVVHHNGEGNVTFTEIDGEDVVPIDMTIQLFSGAAYIVDDEILENSENPVAGGVIFEAMQRHREILQDAIDEAVELMDNMDEGETARATAEQLRRNAETAREGAESQRAANEVARQQSFVQSEAARQEAFEASESGRQTTFRTSEAARQEAFEVLEAGRASTFQSSEAGRASEFNTNEAARQAAIDEKLAQIEAMEFDEEPTEGSSKSVKSSGVLFYGEGLRDSIKRMLPGEGTTAYGGTVTKTKLTINASGLVTTESGTNYKVAYFVYPMTKGTIIHFTATTTTSRTQRIGFTTTDPSTLTTLAGLQLDSIFTMSKNGEFDWTIVVPDNNVYLVFYYYDANWSGRTWRFFAPESLQEQIRALQGTDSELAASIADVNDTLQYDVIKTIEEDVTNMGVTGDTNDDELSSRMQLWQPGGSSAGNRAKSTVTRDAETGNVIVTINDSSSGGRFGIVFKAFPVGKYIMEYDYSVVNNGVAVERNTISQPAYVSYGSNETATGIIVSSDSVKVSNGHFRRRFEHLTTGSFFYAHTINGYFQTGDVITISNFSLRKYTNDISDWDEKFEQLDLTLQEIDGMKWYKRTVMGGGVALGYIDARETIDGEPNAEFGNVVEVDGATNAVTNYIPLLDCDKFRIRVPLTSGSEEWAGKAGAVIYNANKEPIKAINVVTLATYSMGWIEVERTEDMAFVRHHTGLSSANYLHDNVELYYSYDTVRSALLGESFLIARGRNVPTYSKGVRWTDGVLYTTHWHHGNIIVEGYKFLTVKARIVDNGSTYANYGGVVFDKMGNVIDVIYKILESSSSTLTYNITFELPPNAYRVMWCTHKDVTSTWVYTYDYLREWRQTVDEALREGSGNGRNNHIAEKHRSTIEKISEAMWNQDDDFDGTDCVSSGTGRLGLIHFSDWHESTVAGASLMEWITNMELYYAEMGGSKPKCLYTDVINTGDVVENYLSNGKPTAYQNVEGLAEKALFVLGNHDQAYSSNSTRRYELFWADAGETGNGQIGSYSSIEDVRAIFANSHKFSFNRYFANYIDGWGVTMPTGYDDPNSPYYQACYWHKDYYLGKKGSTKYGVRLIGLDCMYRFDGKLRKVDDEFVMGSDDLLEIADDGAGLAKLTTEQETWLYNLVNETLDPESSVYGYAIICMCHYPLDDLPVKNTLDASGHNASLNGGRILDYRTGEVTNFEWTDSVEGAALKNTFWLNNRVRDVNYDYTNENRSGYGFSKGSTNNFGDILKNFQSHGGKVIAWLCGHTHVDHFYYPQKYPDILTVVIDRAGENRPNRISRRNANVENTLCANFYAIDLAQGYFKIVRMGLNTNSKMIPINTLCYDYINKKVISES